VTRVKAPCAGTTRLAARARELPHGRGAFSGEQVTIESALLRLDALERLGIPETCRQLGL